MKKKEQELEVNYSYNFLHVCPLECYYIFSFKSGKDGVHSARFILNLLEEIGSGNDYR